MSRVTRVLSAALLALSSVGCGEPKAPAGKVGESAEVQTGSVAQRTREGTFTVTLDPGPASWPLNEHFALRVVVAPHDSAGATLPGDLDIAVDADMPLHKHGINSKPVVESTGEGRWLVKGVLLHMPGDWELLVDVSSGGRAERAVFTFALKAE